MKFRNEKGFALAICMALLPCFIAGLLLAFSLFGLIQNDLKLKYQCRTEGLSGQTHVQPLLIQLLALNPVAESLRLTYLETAAELAAAYELNPPAVPGLAAELQQIQDQRATLDKQQKQLIAQSNLILRSNHIHTRSQLLKSAQELSNILLSVNSVVIQGQPPKLAVHPNSTDVAPTYSPDENFEVRQSLAHKWQYRMEVKPPFSSFLKGQDFIYEKACAVTLIKDGSKWIPKIAMGKFSLKSVW
ncbi:MAG: hypothetical protein ACXVCY_16465 [Pseudobdellovibrionaceae bacterium]